MPQTNREAAINPGVQYRTAPSRPCAASQAFRAIAYGGLIAGVLDGAYAGIVFGTLRGQSPARVFQFVASGVLGRQAFTSEWSALLGLALHFTVALGAAATYWLVAMRWRTLLARPWLFGPLYGVAVFAFMRYVVVPLSATPKQPTATPLAFFIGLLPHVLFIGPAIVVAASRVAASGRTESRPSSH